MITIEHDLSCPEWTAHDYVQLSNLRPIANLTEPVMVDANMAVLIKFYSTSGHQLFNTPVTPGERLVADHSRTLNSRWFWVVL